MRITCEKWKSGKLGVENFRPIFFGYVKILKCLPVSIFFYIMHAHTFQVFGAPEISTIVNGVPVDHFHENDVSNMSLIIKNLEAGDHVMFFSTLNREVQIISNDEYIGNLLPFNGILAFHCDVEANIRFVFSDAQILKDIEKELVDIFHDSIINPSFGALQLKALEKELESRCPHFASSMKKCVLQSSQNFHCYEGKDKLPWVVLHSHCKKVNIPSERSEDYSQLVKYLIGELLLSDVSLNDLYRKIYKENIFCRLLSSNFTVLKKLLIKFNSEFLWFQDNFSKTTKVIMHQRQAITCA